MKNLYKSLLVSMFAVSAVVAQQTPASKQNETITITGATAHIGNGQVIENSIIVFKEGTLTYVGTQSQNTGGKTIDASGKHVYPGFIVPNASLGLSEIDAVRPTRDFDEIGEIIPHVKAKIAYNAESKVVESMRPNGVLLAQITPRGGTISGTSSVMQLDAWNWEDAVVKADDGIHLNWPSSFTYGRWWLGEEPGAKPDKKYMDNVGKIKNFMLEAKAYLNGEQSKKNLPYDAVKGLYNGSQKLFVHTSGKKEIVDAINFATSQGIKMVLVHGDQAHLVADELVKHKIPVVLDRSHRNPNMDDEDVRLAYKMAKILIDKGIMVTIGMEGQMERMNTRNIPFYAGTYAAYGVPKEEAVKMITLNAAKVLGIDTDFGSLEVGKSATLFISEGDALDMRTNLISHAFIQGRELSLETHQTKLWKRYMNKYHGSGK
ncbi:amidohydrolase family protein [Spongiivirga sp. MCCC 1A20706]|uniref:amidohydrolase family protein n=1 Tax=Spongiivirga sp. MCCC 1A20706 TaxID=3160963 RepID=UPI0039774261